MTGFSADASLDVVRVTKENIKRNPNIEKSLYVIEETHMDGIVIWQNESGEIYSAEYKDEPRRAFGSLAEYIAAFEE